MNLLYKENLIDEEENILIETMKKWDFDTNIIKYSKTNKMISIGNYIIFHSQRNKIIQLISLIGSKKFTVIEGGHSCGKKEILVNICWGFRYTPNKDIIKIKLGPHIDYRDLIGSYTVGDSNQFEWKSGILSSAMIKGSVLILEGWDQVSSELAQFLMGLFDNKSISLPNGRFLTIHDRFRILCTFNTERKQNNFAKLVTEHRFFHICMPHLSSDDMDLIISNKFSHLNCIKSVLIKIFEVARCIFPCPLIDFFKCCKYLCADSENKIDENMINPYSLIIFAINIMCNSCPVDKKQNLFESLCSFLTIDPTATQAILTQRYSDSINLKRIENFTTDICITKTLLNLAHTLNICVVNNDPVLLIGETGVGKTSFIQNLAQSYNRTLSVINVGRHSDVYSLFGGLKPISFSSQIKSIINLFAKYFTNINNANNQPFIDVLLQFNNDHKWSYVLKAMDRALQALTLSKNSNYIAIKDLKARISRLNLKLAPSNDFINFYYIKGVLLQAIIEGNWVLIDEINLAPEEILTALSDILDNQLVYNYSTDDKPIEIHENFRLFACMNPPNDVGKKILPISIYNKFIKIFMSDINEFDEIVSIVSFYLKNIDISRTFFPVIAQFYIDFKNYFILNLSNVYQPYVSLRSLCRALKIAIKKIYKNAYKSLYDGLHIAFLSSLSGEILKYWEDYLSAMFLCKFSAVETIDSSYCNNHVIIEGFFVKTGSNQIINETNYIITGIVKAKLKIIARIIALSDIPILLEGDTAAGKTSLIMYIAKKTGNNCIRINNHEHTDIMDYVGSYTSDINGLIHFNEGVLVQAMRRGDWVIFDELNLAPSDVLEMLNRLLDDNRELFIEETQECIKAHKDFRIFATQNPAKYYSGRKELSKAFRNRFCEIPFYDLSDQDHIETILQKKYATTKIISKFMVSVMIKFQTVRKQSDVFMGKYGFITVRDLFKWCQRLKNYDSDKKNTPLVNSAVVGFHLLSSRCRYNSEIDLVYNTFSECLSNNSNFPRRINLSSSKLLDKLVLHQNNSMAFKHILWTKPMLKNAYLMCEAIKNKEPILLIGDTGCGKTSLCQLYAETTGKTLYTYSCHSSMEAADIIGNLTIKMINSNKIFDWQEGLLPRALKNGGVFLLDEISLADDSVLERVNSVLESDIKSLILYEKLDSNGNNESEHIVAHPDFVFIATMNPSGDYGKRELSHALRNRFTEIWCVKSHTNDHLKQILEHNLHPSFKKIEIFNKNIIISNFCIDLIDSIFHNFQSINELSMRKLLSISYFINHFFSSFQTNHPIISSLYESICSIVIDSFSIDNRTSLLLKTQEYISNFFGVNFESIFSSIKSNLLTNNDLIISYNTELKIHDYNFIAAKNTDNNCSFDFEATDVKENIRRLHRAMLFNKPIILEGPPGCGKTVSVIHLAFFHCKKVTRINFSEQTELSDLFGCYVPSLDKNNVSFKWINGPFIEAIINENWILLDEINLASQTVIEGLNSCFDHRSEVFVSELNRTFKIDPNHIKIFAAQNPYSYASGRKGLPRSFLDRFITLHIENFSLPTLTSIGFNIFPQLPREIVESVGKLIHFIPTILSPQSNLSYNIRDAVRIFEITQAWKINNINQLLIPFYLVFLSKVRHETDFEHIILLFNQICPNNECSVDPVLFYRYVNISTQCIQLSCNYINFPTLIISRPFPTSTLRFFPFQSQYIGLISMAIKMNWPCLITGFSNAGKTTIIKLLSVLYGIKLMIITITSETDLMDIIGDFDYVDNYYELSRLVAKLIKEIKIISNESQQSKLYADLIAFLSKVLSGQKSLLLETFLEIYNYFTLYPSSNKLKLMFEKIKTILIRISDSDDSGTSIKWTDGLLVKCLRKGYWVLFDNINFSNPAIIDRINCLLEPNGSLDISFSHETIKPHPNFRFFATYNPQFGEISHALRNRCIEIYIKSSPNIQAIFHELKLNSILDTPNSYLPQFPAINLIFSNNITKDVILWDYHIIDHLIGQEKSPNLIKLFMIERSTPYDLDDRLQFLHHQSSTFKQSLIYKSILDQLKHIYSILDISFDFCSEIFRSKNYPVFIKSIWNAVNLYQKDLKLFLLIRIWISQNNHKYQQHNGTINILASIDNYCKYIQEYIELEISDLDFQINFTNFSLYYLNNFYLTELKILINQQDISISQISYCWSWLRQFNDRFSFIRMPESEFKDIEHYFGYPEPPQNILFKKMLKSEYCPYFNDSNQKILQLASFINTEKDLITAVHVITTILENKPIEINTICSDQIYHFDELNLFWLLQQLNCILIDKKNVSFTPIDYFLTYESCPLLIRGLFYIFNNYGFKYNKLKSIFFLVCGGFLLGTETDLPLNQNPFKPLSFPEYLKNTLLKEYEPKRLVERFVYNEFPFKISCQDIGEIDQRFDLNCVRLWANFNVYSCWEYILNNQLHNLFLNLSYLNLRPPFTHEISNLTVHNNISELDPLYNHEISKFHDVLKKISDTTDKTDNTLIIGQGFILLGMLILKIYGVLPTIDLSYSELLHDHFIRNILNMIDKELLARRNVMEFYCDLELTKSLLEQDQSYSCIFYFKNFINSLLTNKRLPTRSSEQYDSLKTHLRIFLKSLESTINVETILELSDEFITSISDFRLNLAKNFVLFSEYIEPIQTSIITIQIGINYIKSVRNIDTTKHDSDKNITHTNLDQFYNRIFEILKNLDTIISNYNFKQATQNEAFIQFNENLNNFYDLLEQILDQIQAVELIDASSYKYIHTEFNEIDIFLKPDDNLNCVTLDNKEEFKELLGKVGFYILQKFNQLINITKYSDDCVITASTCLFSATKTHVENIACALNLRKLFKNYIQRETVSNSNIYEHGCPYFLLKISKFLSELKLVIEQLIPQFESPILQEIATYIHYLESLDISSPLIKFLNQLDILYLSISNWNLSAPSEYKLSDHQESVKNIIIQLRKLQLTSWQCVLENSNRKVLEANSLVYFKFFQMIVDINSDIISILNNFFTNQTVFTYSYSLDTFRNITQFLKIIFPTNTNILKINDVINYFAQFAPCISEFFAKNTEKVRRELKDYTGIAKWRDFNYWSIKESSEKAHRNLHKYVRKYQTIMKYPVHILFKKVKLNISKFQSIMLDLKPFCPQKQNILFGASSFDITDNIKLCAQTLNISYRIVVNFIDKIQNWNQIAILSHVFESIHNSSSRSPLINVKELHDIFGFLGEINLWEEKGNLYPHKDIFLENELFCGLSDICINDDVSNVFKLSNAAYFNGLYYYSLVSNRIISGSFNVSHLEIRKIKGYLCHLVHFIKIQRTQISSILFIFNYFSKLDTQLNAFITNTQNYFYTQLDLLNYTDLILAQTSTEFLSILQLLYIRPSIPDDYISPYFPNNSLNHNKINDQNFYDENITILKQMLERIAFLRNEIDCLRSQSYAHDHVIKKFLTEFSFLKSTTLTLLGNLDIFIVLKNNKFDFILRQIITHFDEMLARWPNLCQIQPYNSNESYGDAMIIIENLLGALQNMAEKLNIPYEFDTIHEFFITFEILYRPIFRYNIENIIFSLIKIKNNNFPILFHGIVKYNFSIVKNILSFLNNLHYFTCNLFSTVTSLFLNVIQNGLELVKDQQTEQEPNNNQTTELTNDPIEPSGFIDGQGHKNVTDQIETQDQLEEAVKQENMFDSVDSLEEKDNSTYSVDKEEDGIELSSDIGEDTQNIEGSQDSQDDQEIEQDQISSVSNSVCNELNPEIWNKSDDELSDLQQVQTDKKKIPNTQIDQPETVANEDSKDLPIEETSINQQDPDCSLSETFSQTSNMEIQENEEIGSTISISEEDSISDHEEKMDENTDIPKNQSNLIMNQPDEIGLNDNQTAIQPNQATNDTPFDQDNPPVENQQNDISNLEQSKSIDDLKKGSNSQTNNFHNPENIPDENVDSQFQLSKKRISSEAEQKLDTDPQLKIKKCQILPTSTDMIENDELETKENYSVKRVENHAEANMLTIDVSKNSPNEIKTVDQFDSIEHRQGSEFIEPEKGNLEFDSKAASLNLKSESFFDKTCLNQEIHQSKEETQSNDQKSTNENNIMQYVDQLLPQECSNILEYQRDIHNLACHLCEQLRMILEPTRRNKYSGCYKTGRKINIRKIIPYIASKFTKDKIWLRRTKPINRDYHIIIAVDDSASMRDNNCLKIALQSILLLSTAFRLLEVGKVCVLSFGEFVKTLIDFDHTCTDEICKQAFETLAFYQIATRISYLLENCRDKFNTLNNVGNNQISERLLIIISDGRGIFSEGETIVNRTIKDLKNDNIFILFIIMDTIRQENQSISHIKVPIFHQNSDVPTIKSYLEMFPFPYYIVLRNINDLPDLLSSITRQWLELVIN